MIIDIPGFDQANDEITATPEYDKDTKRGVLKIEGRRKRLTFCPNPFGTEEDKLEKYTPQYQSNWNSDSNPRKCGTFCITVPVNSDRFHVNKQATVVCLSDSTFQASVARKSVTEKSPEEST